MRIAQRATLAGRTGPVCALAGALALIAPAARAHAQPPPDWPNEPDGFVTTIDQGLSSLRIPDAVAGPWEYSPNWAAGGVVAEQGALRWVWRAGRTGGDSPGRAVVQTTDQAFRDYYIGVVVRWSVPWTAHASGANKIVYWGSMEAREQLGHGPSQFYLNRRGDLIDLTLQYAQPNGQSNVPASPGQRLARTRVDDGQWHRIEVLLDGNTAGQPNCRARVWVDGTLEFDVGRLVCAKGDARFYGINLDPVWGGIGQRKPRQEWLEMARIHVSGRPAEPVLAGAWPHEPAGLRLIAGDDWSADGRWEARPGGGETWSANGWTRTSPDVTVVTVDDLPTETSRALQIRTPAGTPAGVGPSARHAGDPSSGFQDDGPYREIYFGYWVRMLRGYSGHPTDPNGQAAILGRRPTDGGLDAFAVLPWATGAQPAFNLRFEATPGANGAPCPYTYSTAAAIFRPGRWQQVEIRYRKPDADGTGGEWRVWVDGDLVQQHDGVCDFAFSPASALVGVELSGVWGRSDGTLATANIQQFGPFRIAAR